MSAGPHYLVVAPFDPESDESLLDVEHPPGCPEVNRGTDEHPVMVENCAVGFWIEQYGISEYFEHADDDGAGVVEPVPEGRHEIEAWHREYRGPHATEYGAGLRLVQP